MASWSFAPFYSSVGLFSWTPGRPLYSKNWWPIQIYGIFYYHHHHFPCIDFLLLCNKLPWNDAYLLLHSSLGEKFRWVQLGFLIRVSQSWNQDVSRVMFHCGGCGEECISLLILVVGRIQCLVSVELRTLLPCWLSSRDHSQFLKAACIPWHIAPSILKASNDRSNSLHPSNLWLSLLLSARENLMLWKVSYKLDWAHPDNMPFNWLKFDYWQPYNCKIPFAMQCNPVTGVTRLSCLIIVTILELRCGMLPTTPTLHSFFSVLFHSHVGFPRMFSHVAYISFYIFHLSVLLICILGNFSTPFSIPFSFGEIFFFLRTFSCLFFKKWHSVIILWCNIFLNSLLYNWRFLSWCLCSELSLFALVGFFFFTMLVLNFKFYGSGSIYSDC